MTFVAGLAVHFDEEIADAVGAGHVEVIAAPGIDAAVELPWQWGRF